MTEKDLQGRSRSIAPCSHTPRCLLLPGSRAIPPLPEIRPARLCAPLLLRRRPTRPALHFHSVVNNGDTPGIDVVGRGGNRDPTRAEASRVWENLTRLGGGLRGRGTAAAMDRRHGRSIKSWAVSVVLGRVRCAGVEGRRRGVRRVESVANRTPFSHEQTARLG